MSILSAILLSFPEFDKTHEDVLHNAENLFTSLLVLNMKDCILHRIYNEKELTQFCKKSIFKKLLIKFFNQTVFSLSNRLIKQI